MIYRHADVDNDVLEIDTVHPEAKFPPGTFALTVYRENDNGEMTDEGSQSVYITTEQACEIANLLSAFTLIPTTAEEIDQWLKS